jgi:hypothetical protein
VFLKVTGNLLYETDYLAPCVGNFIEEESWVCLNFPPASEYQKYVENVI